MAKHTINWSDCLLHVMDTAGVRYGLVIYNHQQQKDAAQAVLFQEAGGSTPNGCIPIGFYTFFVHASLSH